jgi:omega-amidase
MSSLTISIIQSDLHWEDRERNLRMFENKINAITENTEVIILPEMFNTGFSMNPSLLAEDMDGETVTWMKRMASEKRVIIAGSVIIQEDGNYYNRLIWMLPSGDCGVYDKRHRFAYAGEDKKFTAGNKRLIASVKGWKLNLQVCYDLRFPVWARQQQKMVETTNGEKTITPEYDILIYVANWPERRSLAWKSLLQARAIENQCFVVGVNRVGKDGNGIIYSGDSTIIDPLGEMLFTKAHEDYTYTITLHKEQLEEVRMKFPFWKDADYFMLGL